jgi:hypothetical protein
MISALLVAQYEHLIRFDWGISPADAAVADHKSAG